MLCCLSYLVLTVASFPRPSSLCSSVVVSFLSGVSVVDMPCNLDVVGLADGLVSFLFSLF